MRINEMHIEGGAKHFAVLRRQRGAEFIEVAITTPFGEHRHSVQASDREDLWSMAECLQETLDGFRGAGGDIRDYFTPLRQMSDL